MPSEFELIRRHFDRAARHSELAVGDDAALLQPRAGMQLAVSTDMLVAGTHFFVDAEPHALGWKTLAVNVSDLAAMGAEPRWALLAISLPAADEDWLTAFSAGFFECAHRYGIDLVGGDTTRGPLTMTVTIIGELPQGAAVTRAGGRAGDDVWISGTPGLAALGLAALQGKVTLGEAAHARCLAALHRPQPRVELGLALRGTAGAMLDVSDGVLGDLAHILERSAVGAVLDLAALPLDALRAAGADEVLARRCLFAGGDDYELLFTAPPGERDALAVLGHRLQLPLHRIGELTPTRNAQPGELLLRDADGRCVPLAARGYDHFA